MSGNTSLFPSHSLHPSIPPSLPPSLPPSPSLSLPLPVLLPLYPSIFSLFHPSFHSSSLFLHLLVFLFLYQNLQVPNFLSLSLSLSLALALSVGTKSVSKMHLCQYFDLNASATLQAKSGLASATDEGSCAGSTLRGGVRGCRLGQSYLTDSRI